MALQLGDMVPNFTQDSTEGRINFYNYIDGHWAILFSHPADFTPVCTTELGQVAKLKHEFDKRGVKVIGLSVDPLESHRAWVKDIEEVEGTTSQLPNPCGLRSQGCAAVRHDPPQRRRHVHRSLRVHH
ncbi:MAG: hypothetical protein KatS3mg015_2344 [Fimbriimonadales bacterium]|nr:MAG: hypothetical protein KatS3mg015_2344 [Fimbriimonadales bacterium]